MTHPLWRTLFGDFGRIAFFFLGVTLLLLALVVQTALPRLEEHFQAGRLAVLEARLDEVVTRVHRDYFLRHPLDTLQATIRREGPPFREADRIFASLTVEVGIQVTVYLYKDDIFVRSFPAGAPDAAILGRILAAAAYSGEDLPRAQRELAPEIRRLLGEGHRLELIKQWEGGLNGTVDNGQVMFQAAHFPDGYSTMAIIRGFPDTPGRFGNLPPGLRSGAGMADPERQLWLPPAGLRAGEMEIAWRMARQEGGNTVRCAGHDWLFCRNPKGLVWCVVQETEVSALGNRLQWGVYLIFLAGAFWLAGFALAVAGTPAGERLTAPLNQLSIGVQFYALFFLAALVPLGMALMLGVQGLLDRREALLSKAGQEGRQAILGLEQSFHACLTKFGQTARALRDSRLVQEGSLASLTAGVRRMVDANQIQGMEVRDRQGGKLFSTFDAEVHGTTFFIEMFGKIAIRRHGGGSAGPATNRVSAEELISDSLFSGLDPGLMLPMRHPGRVWTFRLGGGSPALLFWDTYPQNATGPAFFLAVHQLNWMFQPHLQYLVTRKTADATEPGTRTSGGPLPISGLLHHFTHAGAYRTTPWLPGRDYPALVRACVRCDETNEILSREVELDNGKFWATIMPEMNFSGRPIFHLVPQETVLEAVRATRGRLAGLTFLALLVAGFAARLLSILFLEPIGDLSVGLEAIQARRDRHRIPWRRADEFGVVVEGFNRLLAEMKELQYGRIVQESLMPAHPPAVPGYAIAFRRCPASDLAGDYHDLFLLEDGRLVCIIGDVTGHGISAALAMAMAKATIGYHSVAGWTFPGEVVENLNLLFHQELRPQGKLMTLACATLDPVGHRLVLENAGHPYAALFRAATGEVTELEAPSFPLGMRRKRQLAPLTAELEPGDTLFLFTDGFPECSAVGDRQFGYEALRELFGRTMRAGGGLDAALDEMMRELDAFREPGPYPDDITLILIRRKAGDRNRGDGKADMVDWVVDPGMVPDRNSRP